MSLILVVLTACGWAGCATERSTVRKTSRSYSQYVMGLLVDRLGDPQDAVSYYVRTQTLDKAAPAPHIQLGLSYIRLKKYPQAAAEFEQVVRLTPDDEAARYSLALLYVQLGELKKAIGQYQVLLAKFIDQGPESVQLRRILSQLYFLDKDFVQALTQCDVLLKTDPSDKNALYAKALIYSEQGRISQAIDGFKEVLKLYPDTDEAMNSLAYLYAENNRELGQALGLAEAAVSRQPDNGAYLDTLGWIYFKLGETDKAIDLLKKAVQLEVDPVVFNHLAEAYYKKGMIDEARRYWVSSLAFDPTQKDVREKLKSIKSRP